MDRSKGEGVAGKEKSSGKCGRIGLRIGEGRDVAGKERGKGNSITKKRDKEGDSKDGMSMVGKEERGDE